MEDAAPVEGVNTDAVEESVFAAIKDLKALVGRYLNAYVLGSAGIGRNEMLFNQNEWRNGDCASPGRARFGCGVPLFPVPFPEIPHRSSNLRIDAVALA